MWLFIAIWLYSSTCVSICSPDLKSCYPMWWVIPSLDLSWTALFASRSLYPWVPKGLAFERLSVAPSRTPTASSNYFRAQVHSDYFIGCWNNSRMLILPICSEKEKVSPRNKTKLNFDHNDGSWRLVGKIINLY